MKNSMDFDPNTPVNRAIKDLCGHILKSKENRQKTMARYFDFIKGLWHSLRWPTDKKIRDLWTLRSMSTMVRKLYIK